MNSRITKRESDALEKIKAHLSEVEKIIDGEFPEKDAEGRNLSDLYAALFKTYCRMNELKAMIYRNSKNLSIIG